MYSKDAARDLREFLREKLESSGRVVRRPELMEWGEGKGMSPDETVLLAEACKGVVWEGELRSQQIGDRFKVVKPWDRIEMVRVIEEGE